MPSSDDSIDLKGGHFHMILRPLIALTLLAPALSLAHAQDAPRSSSAPAFKSAIPNIPGKNLVAVVVDYPPGAKPRGHHQAASAFISAHVIAGSGRSQVDAQPVKVYLA